MRSIGLGIAFLLLGCGSSDGTGQNSPDSEGATSGASGSANVGTGGMPSGGAGNASATGGGGGNGNTTGGGGGSANAAGGGAGKANTGGSPNVGVDAGPPPVRAGGASATGCGTSVRKLDAEGRPRSCISSGVCESLTPRGTFAPTGAPPNLKLGVMTDLGPPFGPITDGGNALSMTFDPNNTAVLYVGVEAKNGSSPNNGIWRSRDGGSTWKVLGTGSDQNPYDCQTTYLDLPINIRVDPLDSNHLYETSGVRGSNGGFWVSWDAGETWTRSRVGDLTAMSVDPCDFCHVIVGSHEGTPIGVLESTDGGYSWIEHPPPAAAGWSGGSYGVNFLYDPASSQGDGKTWLVHNGAMWRTKDAGATWSKVSDIGGIHGFTTVYYAKNGALYSGAGGFPARSTDNGLTWKSSSQGLANAVYYGLTGDGVNVYAMPDGYPPAMPLMSTPESDGMKWTPFGDMKKIERGMQHPRFDPHSGIVYFVNNMTLHAVRVAEPK